MFEDTRFSRIQAPKGPADLVEYPAVIARVLIEQEFRKQGIGGVLDGNHDPDRPVVPDHHHRLPAGRIEEFAEVILGIAG